MRKFLLLACLASSYSAFTQWQSESLIGIHESIAIHDDNTFGIQEANGSLYTTDGGNTFSEYEFVDENGNSLFGFVPNTLEYIDAQTLVCGGFFLSFELEGILRSTNGGQNWSYVYSQTDLNDTLAILDLNFPTTSVGYAVGNDGRIVKSTDSGLSWDVIGNEPFVQYYDVEFYDAARGAIAAQNGIKLTDDGGLSWTDVAMDQPMFGIAWKDANTILVCGYGGLVMYSNDGGQTWTESEGPAFTQYDV
ncbi:MAG: hypothetical protein HKN32_09405, partial [Flavobacteriales bacterium]|nr:hypothetical protein [Flavobacteriales bacterium]